LTAYSLESRAGFVSHRQRSWDSPFGGFPSRQVSRPFSRKRTHVPSTQRLFRRRSAEPVRRVPVPGSIPSESTWRPHGVLSRRPLEPPLGFAPLGLDCEDLDHDFSRSPLTRFAKPWRLLAESAGASEYRSASAPPRPTTHRSVPPAEATLMGFLHLPAPEHSGQTCPGL